MDGFSDYYFWDIDINDLKQIFSNMNGTNDLKAVNYHRKKYCPTEKFCSFQDCCIYFVEMTSTLHVDYKELAELTICRLKLEAIMYGAKVMSNFSCASHVVAYSTSDSTGYFEVIYECTPSPERNILLGKALHVVSHKWLEDSFEMGRKLSEDIYNLRPDIFEGFESGNSLEAPVTNDGKRASSPVTTEKRKRSRPHTRKQKETSLVKPVRRTRRRISSRRAMADLDGSENSGSTEKGFHHLEKGSDSQDLEHESMIESERGEGEHHENIKRLETAGEHTDKPDSRDATVESEGNAFIEDDKKIDETVSTGDESSKGTAEKLEIQLDPVHAMLLDMIPSLNQKNDSTGVSALANEKPEPSTVLGTVKKKISYKDVASQLLKDW